MSRAPIEQALDVGIRAINSLLTVGRGQRMGLFAGSGVGKSVLLGMMARYTSAEVIVVGLDRRTWPRGQGVHRADSWGRRLCVARSSLPRPLMSVR
jgi:F0F1-type ATP synthase beta subunit